MALVEIQTATGIQKVRVCDHCKAACIPFPQRYCSGRCKREAEAASIQRAKHAKAMGIAKALYVDIDQIEAEAEQEAQREQLPEAHERHWLTSVAAIVERFF